MRFGSLFTGIGGFDIAFRDVGMTCAWMVERDAACQSVLARHFPDVPSIHSDVETVGGGNLEPVDLVCGGFPCQDLSIAGRRAGLRGERSGLWWEFHRILGELRPRWCVIENVPGLLSSNGGKDMGAILRALGDLGYGYAYRVLDAQRFGLAQRRKRVFIVGCLGDAARAVEVLLEPEGVRGDLAPGGEAGEEVAGTLGSGFGGRGNDLDGHGAYIPFDTTQLTSVANRSVPRAGDPCHTLNSGAHPPALLVADPICANESRTSSHAGNNPRPRNVVAKGSDVRRLTPTECERLQGFPDGWTEYCRSGGQCDIIGPWEELLAPYLAANEGSWTANGACASCITSAWLDTDLWICRSATIRPVIGAAHVTGWLESMERGVTARATTSHGSDTEIRCNQSGMLRDGPQPPNGGAEDIGLRLRLRLDGPSSPERLSIISTWIRATTRLLTCTFAPGRITVAYTLHWNEPQHRFSKRDCWSLGAASITRASDAARYSQLGNAVAVNVARWIGLRILACLPR